MIWTEYPAEIGNLNVGTGSKHTAWASIDGMVWVECRITLGAGFSVGYFPTVKLPTVLSPLTQGYQPCAGTVMYRQPSTDGASMGEILADNQNRDRVRLYHRKLGPLANVNASQPWAWQVGDSIYALFAIRTWGAEMPAKSTPSTFAVVGDSISAWIDRSDNPVVTTWPNFAPSTDLALAGGWAKGGAKLAEMLTNTTAFGADVLVVLAGTNDLGDVWGTPLPDRIARLVSIVQQSGCPRVLITAVPPLDSHPAWASEWNAVLQAQALLHGWAFVDPWVPFRTAGGSFTLGASADGIHPTCYSAKVAGAAVASSMRTILGLPGV